MYQLKVRAHFDAAHYIKDYPGKCAREHGHRWEVEVILAGDKLGSLNMLIDFSEVKRCLNDLFDHYLDHYQLNDTLHEEHLTAEFLARWLYEQLETSVEGVGIDYKLDSVIIYESPDCGVRYFE